MQLESPWPLSKETLWPSVTLIPLGGPEGDQGCSREPHIYLQSNTSSITHKPLVMWVLNHLGIAFIHKPTIIHSSHKIPVTLEHIDHAIIMQLNTFIQSNMDVIKEQVGVISGLRFSLQFALDKMHPKRPSSKYYCMFCIRCNHI